MPARNTHRYRHAPAAGMRLYSLSHHTSAPPHSRSYIPPLSGIGKVKRMRGREEGKAPVCQIFVCWFPRFPSSDGLGLLPTTHTWQRRETQVRRNTAGEGDAASRHRLWL